MFFGFFAKDKYFSLTKQRPGVRFVLSLSPRKAFTQSDRVICFYLMDFFSGMF